VSGGRWRANRKASGSGASARAGAGMTRHADGDWPVSSGGAEGGDDVAGSGGAEGGGGSGVLKSTKTVQSVATNVGHAGKRLGL
jgi:hypothetical protein